MYGLTEVNREAIKGARLVANPGCYPTTVQLPLYPLLKAGLILTDDIIIDAKSGGWGCWRGEWIFEGGGGGSAAATHLPAVLWQDACCHKQPRTLSHPCLPAVAHPACLALRWHVARRVTPGRRERCWAQRQGGQPVR